MVSAQVKGMPEVAAHAFTVKVDPDTVFFPERLGSLLPSPKLKTFMMNCNEGGNGTTGQLPGVPKSEGSERGSQKGDPTKGSPPKPGR